MLIALHGGAGEDGALRQVLELTGVPYVGSTPDACRAAWDKPTAKATAVAAGLSTPESVTLPHATFRELGATNVLDRIVAHLGLPLMVKPARGGSALGCTAVDKADELPAAMVQCFSYGEAALIEQLVTGTEVAVTVLDGAGSSGDGGPRRCRRWRCIRCRGSTTTRRATPPGRPSTSRRPGCRRHSRPRWGGWPLPRTSLWGCATCREPISSSMRRASYSSSRSTSRLA